MFSQKVLDIEKDMIELRRRLHADPELSFEEFRTTELLVSELQKIPGLELERPTRTGVVAILRGGAGEGRTIALRADIDALPDISGDICMVSQSTMFTDDYREISEYFKKRFPRTLVIDTICGATKERQKDVQVLVENGAQAIVVIGGKHSANTVKLAIMVKRTGLPCFHIETLKELDLSAVKKFDIIGVTAGASTPGFLIDEVCSALEKL